MFEFYFNFINYGEFKVQSFDTLIKHHFHLPKIDSTLFSEMDKIRSQIWFNV